MNLVLCIDSIGCMSVLFECRYLVSVNSDRPKQH